MQANQLCMKDFEVVKELGTGSFGKVDLVRKKDDGGLYALKSVPLNRLNQKEKDNALNQVRLLASIHIPTVIRYYGAFFNADTQALCIVLEYAQGGDLQRKLVDKDNETEGQGFHQQFVWLVAFELLCGLNVLHKNNIIHRDLKSANIFFSKGIAKMGDLNVSKLAADGFCETQTGTPYYTSPEIWKGEKYGSKCDIWSLGCLIYEMCTLKHPFKANDFPGLYRKILSGVYEDIPKQYSSKLRTVLKLCLTVEEQMRPSASQLLSHSAFREVQKSLAGKEECGGEVNLVQSIKCPKVLRFLNARLPLPSSSDLKNHVVGFASRKMLEETADSEAESKKENYRRRKIKTEKLMKPPELEDTQKVKRVDSKVHIKLPPMTQSTVIQKEQGSLVFSTKRLKSIKNILEPLKDANKRLL